MDTPQQQIDHIITALGGVTLSLSDIAKSLGDLQASLNRGGQDDQLPSLTIGARGIDVSLYQKSIDWNQVKAAGYVFAFIKATQSNDIADPLFRGNWSNASAAGLLRGAYHYFKFNVDPILQANKFLMTVGDDHGELPPVLDIEDQSAPANAAAIKKWLDAIEAAWHVKPIIYTGAWWWNPARFGGTRIDWAKDYPLWIAAYIPTPVLPVDWPRYTFWQNSNKGNVPGISVAVDLDVFNGWI